MRQYTPNEITHFQKDLREFASHPDLQCLKDIPQHKGNTTFAHSIGVAKRAFDLAVKWKISVDTISLIHGAMLHDFYLYDTETMPYSDYQHSLIHPKLAEKNAEKYFTLSKKERNIIRSHMWPIPGAPLPRSREAWLVCIADKFCAYEEMHRSKK